MKDYRNTPWVTMKQVSLFSDQIERLVELLNEQCKGVESGDISGYGQSKSTELYEIHVLLEQLQK